jgi:Zn-dependent protease with chaperone function
MSGRRVTLIFCLLILSLLWPSVSIFAQTQVPEHQEREVDSFSLTPEKYQKAIEYRRARYTLYFISVAYTLILLWLMIRYRVAPLFRTLAEICSPKRIIQVLIFTPLVILLINFFTLPVEAFSHSLSLKYGLSIQSWGSWLWDWMKMLLVSMLIASILVWILYGIIRKRPRFWWFFFWLASLPLIVLGLLITPFVIDPLFFKFEPLEQKAPALVVEIEKVVNRGGLVIPRDRMFWMNASEKLKSVNAYVTGIGASKRVVVWDTTVAKMNQAETLYVFGHEMGHYVLNHVVRTVAFLAVLLIVFLYIGFRYMHSLVEKYGIGWDIRNVADYASLPVFIFLFSLFSFLATPIISSYSRVQEHHSDIYGLEVIHGIVPEAQKTAAATFQVLGEINLSDPEPPPFIKFWLYTHPPLHERLMFVRTYDPWKEGRQPKYVK